MTQADLGNNFFVDEDCVGKSRAASVTQLLQELNEHVSGSYVAEDISQVLDSRPDFLNAFNLVIATQLATKELTKVAEICAARRIQLIVVHTYGFMGYIRMMLNEHQVVETHPDHPFPDHPCSNHPCSNLLRTKPAAKTVFTGLWLCMLNRRLDPVYC